MAAQGSCTCISFACTQTSKQSFLWILASRSVGYSVDSKNLNPVGFCVICAFCGELQAKFFSAARLRFITPNVCNYKTFGVIQLWTYIKFENPNNQKSKMTLMTNDLNDTLTNPCILRWRQTMGIIFTCSSFVCSSRRMHRLHRSLRA